MISHQTTTLNRQSLHRVGFLILIIAVALWAPYATQAAPQVKRDEVPSVITFAATSANSLSSTCPYVPGGSYHQTCRDIQVTLWAECQKLDGSWEFTTLDLTNQDNVDIANTNGTLQVVGNSSTPLQSYIPHGRYQQTCRDIQVTLWAECQKLDGSWEFTTLNLTPLSHADVVNSDGKLFAQ